MRIGEKYYLDLKDDPFTPKREFVVTIIDVSKNWVRYSFDGDSIFKDNRMEERRFLSVYRKLEAPK